MAMFRPPTKRWNECPKGPLAMTQIIREVKVAGPPEHVFAVLSNVGEIADKLVLARRNEEDAEQLQASLKALCETGHGA